MNPITRYWICTASKEHVLIGVEGGFAQVCHGKKRPLAKMKERDWIVYYSSRSTFKGRSNLKSFTAIGRIADGKIYQVEMFPGFKPFRRKVDFISKCREAPIRPLLEKMTLTAGNAHWGASFRYGIKEINGKDFSIIKKTMVEGEK